MSKRKTTLLALTGVLAGLTFGFISPAAAGLVSERPVRVWIDSAGYPSADGSFTSARFAALSDHIQCAYHASSNYIECDALQDLEGPTQKSMTCLVEAPSTRWLYAFSSLNRNSYVIIHAKAGGLCGNIEVYNGSQYY